MAPVDDTINNYRMQMDKFKNANIIRDTPAGLTEYS